MFIQVTSIKPILKRSVSTRYKTTKIRKPIIYWAVCCYILHQKLWHNLRMLPWHSDHYSVLRSSAGELPLESLSTRESGTRRFLHLPWQRQHLTTDRRQAGCSGQNQRPHSMDLGQNDRDATTELTHAATCRTTSGMIKTSSDFFDGQDTQDRSVRSH